jgi:hypothetical protein
VGGIGFGRETLRECVLTCVAPQLGEQKFGLLLISRRDETRRGLSPVIDCIEIVGEQEREARVRFCKQQCSGFCWRWESWVEEGKREAITVSRQIDQSEQSKREREREGQIESAVASRDETTSRPDKKY